MKTKLYTRDRKCDNCGMDSWIIGPADIRDMVVFGNTSNVTMLVSGNDLIAFVVKRDGVEHQVCRACAYILVGLERAWDGWWSDFAVTPRGQLFAHAVRNDLATAEQATPFLRKRKSFPTEFANAVLRRWKMTA